MKNEFVIKEWIELPINCMVEQSVTHTGFMNISWLWVGNVKRFVCAMYIRSVFQFTMKRKDVLHKIVLENLHVFPFPLSSKKLFPCT